MGSLFGILNAQGHQAMILDEVGPRDESIAERKEKH